MLTYFDDFLADPKGMLLFFLLAFPGRILALSAHEYAHAWVASRCGDDTAKMMGRLTLNPLKHLDPLGTILMLLVGFGWAKPVPVNPRNYRNYRADDLKVSVAGVTMNLILFFVGTIILMVLTGVAVATANVPMLGASVYDYARGEGFYSAAVSLAFFRFGNVGGYLAEMVYYFTVTNLVLCIFNLLPVPPLDGYHVLNDLVLKNNLFANPQTARIASSALFVLVMTGAVGKVLGWVDARVLSAVGTVAAGVLRAMGLMG